MTLTIDPAPPGDVPVRELDTDENSADYCAGNNSGELEASPAASSDDCPFLLSTRDKWPKEYADYFLGETPLAGRLIACPLDLISASPDNPRTLFDDDALCDLAPVNVRVSRPEVLL